jgi:hypothetical protein
MKKTIFALLALLLVTVNSCFLLGWGDRFKRARDSREGWERIRDESRNVSHEEAVRQVEMYKAIEVGISHGNTEYGWLDKVKQYLEEGYDPNRSDGEEWSDNTSLHLVAKSNYGLWLSKQLGEEIPDPPPDIEIFQMLIDAGADVNQWPYIWCRVYRWDFTPDIFSSKNLIRTGRPPATSEEMEELKRQEEEYFPNYLKDVNRVLEAFLKAGADPDKRGHPYPYSLEAKRRWISDEEANEYFAKGTRPINEAIKKGMLYESQVDLLLQYTTLDKDSLKAAKQSKDKAMIEKITRLWNEQNGRR